MVSTCVLIATYYRADVRRHLDDLLTLTARPSRSGDAVVDWRQRRAVHVDLEDSVVNGVVKLYNVRRRQYVALAPPRDVTVTPRRHDVTSGVPERPPRHRRHLRSVHFSNQISCSSCE